MPHGTKITSIGRWTNQNARITSKSLYIYSYMKWSPWTHKFKKYVRVYNGILNSPCTLPRSIRVMYYLLYRSNNLSLWRRSFPSVFHETAKVYLCNCTPLDFSVYSFWSFCSYGDELVWSFASVRVFGDDAFREPSNLRLSMGFVDVYVSGRCAWIYYPIYKIYILW